MSSLLPWVSSTKQAVPAQPAAVEPAGEITIHNGSPLANRNSGTVVQVRSKDVMVAGKVRKVHPHQLIRLIKRVTQNIGEYKSYEDVYSGVIIGALRKARGDLVNILESQFGIHWQVDPNSGESVFYM